VCYFFVFSRIKPRLVLIRRLDFRQKHSRRAYVENKYESENGEVYLVTRGSNARTVNEYLKKIRCNITIKENVQEKKND